jgi:pimeloyl-ACP methyl ester carboxylesterase
MNLEPCRIPVPGAELAVFVAGDGPAVLLVHGFPDCHEVWREQFDVLVAAGYRVIAPDLRGCGESTAPSERAEYTLDRLVHDLVAVLDALHVECVRLVAHDWGAVIGWQFCLSHPTRVERYVALSVGHPNAYASAGWAQRLRGWYVLFLQLRGVAEALIQWRQWWLLRNFTGYAREFPRWRERLSRPGRLTAAINYYRANLHLFWKRSWPSSRVPTLGVWSSGDRFLVERQMTASAQYVDAPWRYARVEDANHWLQLEAVGRVNRLLLDYLADPICATERA